MKASLAPVAPYRRITVAVGVSMFVDASLWLAVLPLLPHYASRFGLGTFQTSLVLAAYPASVPFVSVACIVLVPRVGARRISLASAFLMTTATLIYAWSPNVEVLILARAVQGLASGTIWTASMAWVTHNAPPDRRGRESGIVMGLLSAGSIAGPGIGALAVTAGSDVAFGLVAVISAAAVLLTLIAPAGEPVDAEPELRRAIARGARQPATMAALAISVIDLSAFGAVDLLVPLHLGRTGTSIDAIAAAFAAGALLGAVVGPPAGRLVDLVGPGSVGLAVAAVITLTPLALAFGLPDALQLAVLVVAGPMFAVLGAAMFPLSSRGADAAGVAHVTVMGLLGVAWAAGFAVMPPLVGAVAQVTSTAAAFAFTTVICASTMVLLWRCVRHPELLVAPALDA